MPLSCRCPHCVRLLQIEESLAGQLVRCAACGHTFLVPLPEEPFADLDSEGSLPRSLRHDRGGVSPGWGILIAFLVAAGLLLAAATLGYRGNCSLLTLFLIVGLLVGLILVTGTRR